MLGLFGRIGKIPDTGIKCLPRHVTQGRLPHTGLAASSGGAVSPGGPQNTVSVVPGNESNDRTTSAWVNGTSGVASDGGAACSLAVTLLTCP